MKSDIIVTIMFYKSQIYIFGNESKFDREIQINSTLEAVYIQNMIQDMVYKIQMSAFNRIGEGFRSEPIVIGRINFFHLFQNFTLN